MKFPMEMNEACIYFIFLKFTSFLLKAGLLVTPCLYKPCIFSLFSGQARSTNTLLKAGCIWLVSTFVVFYGTLLFFFFIIKDGMQ